MVEAIKQNFPQREIADASWRYQQEVDAGQRIVVGVNGYQQADEERSRSCGSIPALERKQMGRVEATRRAATAAEVERTLGELKARRGDRRQPDAADPRLRPRALLARARWSRRCRQVFGSYTELPVF